MPIKFKKILLNIHLIRKVVIGTLVLVILVLVGVFALMDPAFKLQLNALRYRYSASSPGLQSLVTGINKVLQVYGVQATSDLAALLNTYNENRNLIDSRTIFFLPEIKIANEEVTETRTDFQEENVQDRNFFLGEKYISVFGKQKVETTRKISLNIAGNVVTPQVLSITTTQELQNELTAEGTKPLAEIQTLVQESFTKLHTALKTKDEAVFREFVVSTEPTIETLMQNPNYQFIVDRLSYKAFNLSIEQVEDNVTEIPVADIVLSQSSCAANLAIKLVYVPETSQYLFKGINELLNTGCKPATAPAPAPGGSVVTLNCSDCWLAPVDKTRALRSDYVPAGLTTLNLLGGGVLTSTAAQAAANLFQAAQTVGIQMQVVSSYRSYATQQVTFENWVQSEMAQGYDRATAEVRANVYSARPGHSEHQLGTVMDVSCYGCAAFDNSAGNVSVYNYLAANAHKYGFVISYPPNTQQLTGYKYEPWHIRYIGVDLATQFFNTGYTSGNGRYVAEFLSNL